MNQMSNDATYTNISLVIAFLKHFDRTYLGASGIGGQDTVQDLPEGMEELVLVDTQKSFKSMFVAYFNGASKTLVRGQVVCPEHF